jgi:pimeloyl-ACP methyl ester carboxylesterase
MASVNGKRLWVSDIGEGRPVAFVHGLGTTSMIYQPLVEALGAGYRTIRFDLEGHGRSPLPEFPLSRRGPTIWGPSSRRKRSSGRPLSDTRWARLSRSASPRLTRIWSRGSCCSAPFAPRSPRTDGRPGVGSSARSRRRCDWAEWTRSWTASLSTGSRRPRAAIDSRFRPSCVNSGSDRLSTGTPPRPKPSPVPRPSTSTPSRWRRCSSRG